MEVQSTPKPVKLWFHRIFFAIGIILAAQFSDAAFAQKPSKAEKVQVQREMLRRVSRVVNQFSQRIGASEELVSYCDNELRLHTLGGSNYTAFTRNYKYITDMPTLNHMLLVREKYEVTFLKLCIARAKRDIDAVLK